MDKVRDATGRGKDKKAEEDTPALWPLIRQVNVRCPSAALSTGAVLVDLPGMGLLFYLFRALCLLEHFRCC